MPAVSQAQNRAMHAAAAGHSTLGIPQSVGREFTADQAPGSVKRLPERKTPAKPHAQHALSIASAEHLHRAGHIDSQTRDAIQARARRAMGKDKSKQEAPRPFGSLAPRA